MPDETSNNILLAEEKQNIKNSSMPLNLSNNHQEMIYNSHNKESKMLLDEITKKPKVSQSNASTSSFFISDILNSNTNKNDSNDFESILKSNQTLAKNKPNNILLNENRQISNEDLFLQNQTNPYNLAFLNGIFKKTLEAGLQPTLANINMTSIKNNVTQLPSEICSPINSCIDESRDYSKDDSSSISEDKNDSDSGKYIYTIKL